MTSTLHTADAASHPMDPQQAYWHSVAEAQAKWMARHPVRTPPLVDAAGGLTLEEAGSE